MRKYVCASISKHLYQCYKTKGSVFYLLQNLLGSYTVLYNHPVVLTISKDQMLDGKLVIVTFEQKKYGEW
ncbi:hypothetical protein SAMN05661012_05513 [Chitinophaga sancti]|uniref:Uncharacterized protein n=1 Tax=Chitinophaga sancti TaxID=1004 RepID=A0A1K1SKC6_9BACT|nr:hypothetical protein SAMN05661012_05513 [Chitinophaga sancti]